MSILLSIPTLADNKAQELAAKAQAKFDRVSKEITLDALRQAYLDGVEEGKRIAAQEALK